MPRIVSPYDTPLPLGWDTLIMDRAVLTGVDVYELGEQVGDGGQHIITYRTDDGELSQADVGLLIVEAIGWAVTS